MQRSNNSNKPQPVIASWRLRATAQLIDLMVVILFSLILFRVSRGINADELSIVLRGLVVLSFFIYRGILNSAVGGGRTLGKRLVQIKVVNRRLQPLSLVESFIRVTVELLFTVLPFLLVLDFAAAFFKTRFRRTLHDRIAGSYVVQTENAASVLWVLWRIVGVPFAMATLAVFLGTYTHLRGKELRRMRMHELEMAGHRYVPAPAPSPNNRDLATPMAASIE